ncbi:hypothetical protein HAPAU_03410 [Halalkalicoccus paucihalophilus]|uniref:Uncharacterized protein n=1 Tax=Halalkalicoccus paucihalophilus TaxID=1008153 RepID=A0A151AJ67_9EURY|nr:hypothetical protein [Halalkalicoccus paucihalophilus]KYH27673.1 hypothetical protein HAPAU_03410 [Halalkalicoccus paucihalophilus]
MAQQRPDLAFLGSVELVELAHVVDERTRDDGIEVDPHIPALDQGFGERDRARGYVPDVCEQRLLGKVEFALDRRVPRERFEVLDASLLDRRALRVPHARAEVGVLDQVEFREQRVETGFGRHVGRSACAHRNVAFDGSYGRT